MFSALFAAVSYGAFTALNRKWDYDYDLSMMIAFFATALLSFIVNFAMGAEFNVGIPRILGFAWNGFFVMALATITWALALKDGGTAKVSNFAYITPFLSFVRTFFILKEPISPLSVVGLALIVLGIFIQLKDKKEL